MKRMFLSLGLSVTILLSAAFAQGTMQRATTPAAKSAVELTSQKQLASTKRLVKKRINPNTTRDTKVSLQRVACYKSEANPDKAVVKLIVSMDWGDGSGYQVLLDNKAEFISMLNENGGIVQETVRDLYSAATTKIPANAQPEFTGSHIMYGESDSAIIDPGTYDMIVTNPTEETAGLKVYIAGEGAFDDIEFEKGTTYVFNVISSGTGDYVQVVPDWDMSVTELILPVGNCETTEAPVTMKVFNNGKYAVKDFEVFYYLTDLDGEPVGDSVKETCSQTVASAGTIEYTFSKKIQFTEDAVYGVYAGVLPLEKETITGNNEYEGVIVRKSAVEIPYTFNLDSLDIAFDIDVWDIMEDADEDLVLTNYLSGYPAVTRCLTMEAGESYRLAYERITGFSFWGIFEIPVSYRILFGKANTDISTWKSLYFGEELFNQDYTIHTVSTQVTETGEYAFAFVEDSTSKGGGIMIKNISVAKVLSNDVKLDAFKHGMPSMLPLEHASGTFKASATVTNYGKNTIEEATLNVTAGDKVIFTKKIAVGKADTTVTEDFDLQVAFDAIADVELTASVSIDNDEDPDNNELSQLVKVTDAVMAYDYVTEDMYTSDYAIGSTGGAIGCGLPFTIAKKDTLTGVSIGWSAMEEDMNIEISVYKWDAATKTLGNMFYRESHRRGTDSGQREYKIPALLLEPGDYMVSVHQTSATFYGLIADKNRNGILYVTSTNPVNSQTNLGYPAIRAIFGHDGKPIAKDLAVKEISKPKERGLFSNEEPIVIKVRNNGFEAAEAPLAVMVNKDNLPTQTVKLAAYAEAEYTFKGDLSASDAEFLLSATVTLEGDENAENNTLTKTVHSLPPADPFKMDFEYCEDFAIDNELTLWKGICGPSEEGADGSYGFNGINFEHSGELFAFIAYNGTMSVPETGDGMAHGGDRFGASFAWLNSATNSGVPNNAWLVSPQLKLAEKDPCIKFSVKSYTDEYGLEKYNVLISTSDNKLESFVQIGKTFEAPAEWTDVTVNLAEYSGKDVYLAIQCVSNDAFIFMIDDIIVTTSTAIEGKAANIRLNAWPNPASEMVYISADQAIEQVSIYTPAGNLIYQSANNMNAEEFRYSVKKLTSGLYIARVKTAQGTGVVKFVVR